MNDTSKLNRERKRFPLSKATVMVMGALGMFSHGQAFAAEESADASEETEVIEVTGLRSSVISAMQAKMNSDKIMDGISADDIGALPDRSITEALQRIPGVSIDRYMSQGDPEHFSVEGNGVIIRGLTQVRSELNGRSSFSANGGRSLSFGDVPPELMNAVNVYKAPSADQIEGGLSGTVDLETKLPFHNDEQKISISAAANYGDMIEETKPEYSALYSNVWQTGLGKIGLLVDVAHSEISTRNDSMYVRPFWTRTDITGKEGESVYIPRGADWRTMYFERERNGQYAALQWAPSDEHEFTLTYFNSEYDMFWSEDAIFVGNNPTSVQIDSDIESVYSDSGRLVSGRLVDGIGISMGSDARASIQNSQTTDIALEYSGKFDKFEVNFSVQRVDADAKGQDNTVATEVLVPYIDVDFSGSLPSIQSDEQYLSDPSKYNWNFIQDNAYDRVAEMTAVDADVKYFLDNDVFKYVQTGVRFTDSKSDNADTSYNWAVLATSWVQWAITDDKKANINPAPEELSLNTFDNFFRGEVPKPSSVYAPVVDFVTNHPETFQQLRNEFEYTQDWVSPWQLRSLEDPEYTNSQTEKTTAAFAKVGFEIPANIFIAGDFGVRYVKTENTANGFLEYPNVSYFGQGKRVSQSAFFEYSNLLPSFNIRAELADDLMLRFSAAKTMARPDYNSLGANLYLGASVTEDAAKLVAETQAAHEEDPTVEVYVPVESDYNLGGDSYSNPYRKPMESTQLDLSLEWYYSDSSYTSLALFSKDITGYEAIQTRAEEYDGNIYNVSRPVSSGKADMKGVEFAVSHFFDTLPAPFDGLGISANYTYIDSSTSVEQDAEPYDTDGSTYGPMPFKGISKNSYNLVGMYEKNDWSFRLAYNWRSEFLTSTRANGFKADDNSWALPVFNEDAGYLDGSITYRFNDVLSVSLQANNLANTVSKTEIKQNASGNYYGAYHMNDRRYSLAIRANF